MSDLKTRTNRHSLLLQCLERTESSVKMQELELIVSTFLEGGIIVSFAVSKTDNSLVDLAALRTQDGFISAAGQIEILPAIFPATLAPYDGTGFIVGSRQTLSISDEATVRSVTSPILDPSIGWERLLRESIDLTGAILRWGEFVVVEYPLEARGVDADGPFSAMQVWIGLTGNPNLEQIFAMCAWNAMVNGDGRQTVTTQN